MATRIPTAATGFDPYDQHLVAGGELLRQERIEDAKQEFLAALALRPGEPKALALLGLAYFRLSAFEDALPVYRQLVALRPRTASYRLNLGLVYLKLGQPREAIAELKRSRELDPSQSRTVSHLGLAYARDGQYAAAYQAFLQAGQGDLAREMEQQLRPEEADAIARAVSRRAGEAGAPADAGRAGAAGESPGGSGHASPGDPSDGFGEAVVAADGDAAAEQDDDEPAVVRAPSLGEGIITRAVEQAAPSLAAHAAGTRVAAGHVPPLPLSEYATSRLVRPEDGDHPFEISAGGVLIVRVADRMFARTEGVDVTGGDLAYEPACRRVRGSTTKEPFSSDGRPMFIVSGEGHLIAAPLGETFTAVTLDDDIFYLREDLVFAFEPELRWENGHVPGSRGAIHMVQFRGHGAVAFRTPRPLLAIKLAPDRVLYVDADVLAGWIGRVVPRAVAPAGGGSSSTLFVECSGEGVVLVQEAQELPSADHEAGVPPDRSMKAVAR